MAEQKKRQNNKISLCSCDDCVDERSMKPKKRKYTEDVGSTTSISKKRKDHLYHMFDDVYTKQKKIGTGGFGEVYAGIRNSDERAVAIKVINKFDVDQFGDIDGRIVPMEFEMLKKSSGNKGIIEMIDWFDVPEEYILVMEKPKRVIDLYDHIQKSGGLPEEDARFVFLRIVAAISHCHRNGVVHRDIKDENIIIDTESDEIKLIDFGSAIPLKSTPYVKMAGTSIYYPPEWYESGMYHGRQLDAWCLGVVLYMMVEAHPPFLNVEDILNRDISFERGINFSPTCRDLIHRLLEKDPEKRLTINNIFRHEWFAECDYSTS